MLESTMLRICEIKFQLCQHNPRTESLYVHLDQLLFDLKYDPSVVEIPVPRYFKEVDDKIEVKIAFKEAVVRPGKKKKKGRKKKGKKKKKKEEVPVDKMTLWKQTKIVECAYQDVGMELNLEEGMGEKVHDVLQEPMSIEAAIRHIQTFERGC